MVVPFTVYYIISIPIKYILVAISGDSIMIRSQDVDCCQSTTKCKKCKISMKSAKEVSKVQRKYQKWKGSMKWVQ